MGQQGASPWAVVVELILHLQQPRLELVALHQHLPQLLQREARPVGVPQACTHTHPLID